MLIEVFYSLYRQDRDSVTYLLDVLIELNMFLRDTVLIPKREEIEILDFVLSGARCSSRS